MFDPTKPVQTRDGREAIIVSPNSGNTSYPLYACITEEDGDQNLHLFTENGGFYEFREDDWDLINIPEAPEGFKGEVTKFFNVGMSFVKLHAAAGRHPFYPVVEITFKDGKYVSHTIHKAAKE